MRAKFIIKLIFCHENSDEDVLPLFLEYGICLSNESLEGIEK
jgi:hypothetical protein